MSLISFKGKIELILFYLENKSKDANLDKKTTKKDKIEDIFGKFPQTKTLKDENLFDYKMRIESIENAKILEELLKSNLYKKFTNATGFRILESFFNNLIKRFTYEEKLTNEYSFFDIMKEISSLDEYTSSAIFTLFTCNRIYTFTQCEFVILFLLLFSVEYDQFSTFIQTFCEEVYEFISRGNLITLNKLKELARIIGYRESLLSKISQELNFKSNQFYDMKKYVLFYNHLSKYSNKS